MVKALGCDVVGLGFEFQLFRDIFLLQRVLIGLSYKLK